MILYRIKNSHLILTIVVFLLPALGLNAQHPDSVEFMPFGKPILQLHFNYHSSIVNNMSESSMELRRAYLGYEYQISKEFAAYVKIDIGSPDDVSEYSRIRRYAYFKNAALRYKKDKLETNAGIIDVLHFKLQEKIWGHRYIAKSFSDRYRFGPKADIGANIIYKFNQFVVADFAIMNGEGYTNLQRDNTFKGGMGVTVYPFKNLIARVYYDLMDRGVVESTLATFIGYNDKKWALGCEYNHKFNKGYMENHDQFGYSVYGSYNFLKKFQLFARYDKLNSNILLGEDQPWQLLKDGSAIIAGIQYSPIKQVKIALDYQDWVPYAKNMDYVAFIFINFFVKI